MLILSRKVGEAIRIGDDIEVVVTAVDKHKVKLGINSPRQVPIYRQELYEKIQQDNRVAAGLATADLHRIFESFVNGKIDSRTADSPPHRATETEE